MDSINTQFKTLHKKYNLLFLSRACHFINCRETAKDILQEVYISVVQKLIKESGKAKSEDALKRIILQGVTWRAIDEYRKKQKNPEISISYIESEEENALTLKVNDKFVRKHALEHFEGYRPRDLGKIVRQANLCGLDELVVDKYLEGQTIDQIAKELKLEPRQVTNCKYRVLIKLKKLVAKNSQ